MVGGSWEGGYREERSKCTALRFACVCVVLEDCVILAKEGIMIIVTQGRNSLIIMSLLETEQSNRVSEAGRGGVQGEPV